MSVLVVNRKESRYECQAYAIELRGMIIELSQRNFGIRNIHNFARKQYATGNDETEDIDKYYYMLSNYKRTLDKLSLLIMSSLSSVIAIHPINLSECNLRRNELDKAVSYCRQILTILQDIVRQFKVDINIYESYIKAIDREIGLIKKLRRKDNLIRSKFTDNF